MKIINEKNKIKVAELKEMSGVKWKGPSDGKIKTNRNVANWLSSGH